MNDNNTSLIVWSKMPIKCSGCEKDVQHVRVTIAGVRLCMECYHQQCPAGGGAVKIKCQECGEFVEEQDGAHLEGIGFVCDECDEAAEAAVGQTNQTIGEAAKSTTATTANIPFYTHSNIKHIRLKLKGTPTAIEFFNFVMNKVDRDWPWRKDWPHEPFNTDQCQVCNGHCYKAPTVDPEFIKLIAHECGLRKCKVVYFGDAGKCVVGVI